MTPGSFAATLLLAAFLSAANPAAAQAGKDAGPTLGRIAEVREINLGHRESATPFSYVNPDPERIGMDIYAGYSWDICLMIVDALEKRVGRKVEARPVTMPANTRIMMVKVGIADIECGSSTNNVARQKLVAFSNTFYVADVRIMVRKDHGIRSLGDLNGKRVVTTLGTTADRLIKQQALARNLSIDYLVGRSHAESMALMNAGRADAFVGDDAIVAAQRAGSPLRDKFAFLDETLATEPYGLMLPRDDPQFKKFVDEVLVDLMQSGELARLYDKWFMNPIPPDGINLQMPMSEKLKAAIANPNDKPVN
jgi:glutamate/aspartate transport system substrate-binding protein